MLKLNVYMKSWVKSRNVYSRKIYHMDVLVGLIKKKNMLRI
jgi:hypothetical protein